MGTEVLSQMHFRDPGALDLGEKSLRRNLHLLRGASDFAADLLICRLDLIEAVFLKFQLVVDETLDRCFAARGLSQNPEELHPLLDVDIGNRAAIDRFNDSLGSCGRQGCESTKRNSQSEENAGFDRAPTSVCACIG
ncbi:MAG TPA: hypothetical protein VL492_12175 [Methylovirgula sp.]|nr:hypothetical protein [Methylovirgula sp.]